MDEAKITQMQNENNRLREENKTLREGNQRLAKSLGFNRDYIEMAAKLKAVEYLSLIRISTDLFWLMKLL